MIGVVLAFWLEAVRLVDIAALCLAAGFLGAAGMEASKHMRLPRYVHALGISYAIFALFTGIEVAHRYQHGHGFGWITVAATAAAAAGLTSCIWAYLDIKRFAAMKPLGHH